MNRKSEKITVLTNHQDVLPFIDNIIDAADQNKNALGFYAASVFHEFAKNEQLYVAVKQHNNNAVYAGHLLFNCRHPKASILQIFVSPAYRGHGVATALLGHLKSQLTEHSFISVYARVAEDLIEANGFWENQGFYVQRVTPGGVTRKRTILVRSHELASPQLFGSSGHSSANPLGLEIVASDATPLFLLDLNVLYDLGPRRIRHEEAIDLFRAERIGLCHLAISEELSKELQRTATTGRTDPMQMYTKIFPVFSYLNSVEWNDLFSDLATLIFREKDISSLSENDKSDLRHLETAIQHRLAGFITNDAAILNASTIIKERYGIQVISPIVFKQTTSETTAGCSYETPTTDTLALHPIKNHEKQSVYELLSKLNISGSAISSEWAVTNPGRVTYQYGIWSSDNLLGYLTWPEWNPNGTVIAHIAIDESSLQSLNAARALLTYLLEHAAAIGPIQIKIEFPRYQVCIREIASNLGFSGTSNQTELSKIVLGHIVTTENWEHYRESLLSIGRLKLPEIPPIFHNISQQIELHTPDGNRTYVSLESLETLLAPALICLPGRGAVITPVQRDYSEHLLGHSPQKTLLPQSRVTLFREKHYLSSQKTLKHFKHGELILFYESLKRHGLGAIVAIGRIKHAYLKLQGDLQSEDLDPSVINPANIEAIGRSKTKTVTVFDNVMHFKNPVPIKTLKKIGCGSPINLLTTRPISDNQLQLILSEGTNRE